MNHEFVLAIVVAVTSSTGGWGALQLWLTSKQKKAQALKDEEAQKLEARRSREAENSEVWYRESRHNYGVAKEETASAKAEAASAKAECNECRKDLERTRTVVYLLFEEFEDQVIPILGLPETDSAEVRAKTREIIRRARESLRAASR